jgi:hypothetical protein
VQSVDSPHRRSFPSRIQRAIFHHPLPAGTAFFRGLKEKSHGIRQFHSVLRESREHTRGPNQNRGVTVMAAGVHPAFRLRFPVASVFFHDRKPVDVCAQRNGMRTRARQKRKGASTASKPIDPADSR